jgi:hypothetical protein
MSLSYGFRLFGYNPSSVLKQLFYYSNIHLIMSRAVPTGDSDPIPDDEHGNDLPLTMSASVVLTALPRDAHTALRDAGELEQAKGTF